MEEMIINTLKEYGLVGAMLAYFLWKDSKTFAMFRVTMREIVDELKEIKKDVDELKRD